MKTKEEIEKLAEQYANEEVLTLHRAVNREIKQVIFNHALIGFKIGYDKCKEDFSNSWTKGCECGENSIGQTWCCNQCGLPYDTRKQSESEISDGYHTMSELYEHRNKLFIVLCSEISKNPQYQAGQKSQVWRSKRHSDDSYYSGWFIMGIGKESGEQITYHLPESLWEKTDFADTLEKSPQYDYHTPNDVLNRLMDLL